MIQQWTHTTCTNTFDTLAYDHVVPFSMMDDGMEVVSAMGLQQR